MPAETGHPGSRRGLARAVRRLVRLAASHGAGRRPAERARPRRRVPDLAAHRVRRRVARRVRDALRGVARRRARRSSSATCRLALSVFLVASFIAMIGFRFYVAPLFELGLPLGRALGCSHRFWPSGPVLSGATKMRWMCRSLKRHRPSSPRTYASTKSATSVGIAGDSGGSPYWPNVMQTHVPRARVALSMSSLSPEYRWRAVRFCRGRAAAEHLLELGLAARHAAAVRVVDVVDEQLEQRVDVVVIEVIAERRVQVLERDADREPLELAQGSRHAPSSFCSMTTGFSCVPSPSIVDLDGARHGLEVRVVDRLAVRRPP